VESVSNIVVGYGLAVLAQLLVLSMFGLHGEFSVVCSGASAQ
jgi:hypothetical protein